MAQGSKLISVIYTDNGAERTETFPMTLGDALRADAWALETFEKPAKPDLRAELSDAERDFNLTDYRIAVMEYEEKASNQAGFYAMFLAAKRARLPYTEGDDHIAWLDHVTVEAKEEEKGKKPKAAKPGESDGPAHKG